MSVKEKLHLMKEIQKHNDEVWAGFITEQKEEFKSAHFLGIQSKKRIGGKLKWQTSMA